MKRFLFALFILLCLVAPPPVLAKDCSTTSVGLTPLNDLLGGSYKGKPGGLYPNSNTIPPNHLQIGKAASQSIQPLGLNGTPNPNGKIVLLAVGMSNTRIEFQRFVSLARHETAARVAMVNGALPGYDAARIADPNSDYWNKVDAKLASQNASPLQVQAVWVKEAVAQEVDPFPANANELKQHLKSIVLIISERYPNVKTIYFTSRIYGGYATTNTSGEPWAYEGGFAVKWLIEDQILQRDPALAYNHVPWLAWGPYLWADGRNPRADGLNWQCSNFKNDGVHPAASGATKVANKLLDFFLTHPTTLWFSN